jgi:hypothetical protein
MMPVVNLRETAVNGEFTQRLHSTAGCGHSMKVKRWNVRRIGCRGGGKGSCSSERGKVMRPFDGPPIGPDPRDDLLRELHERVQRMMRNEARTGMPRVRRPGSRYVPSPFMQELLDYSFALSSRISG